MLIVRREFSGSASGAFANPCGLIGELRSVIVTLQQPVHTNSHESPTVNYRKFWPCFGCNIFLSHFAIFHEFAWLHMEMSTREKFAHGGSGHVDTVGVRGSNPLSRTIQKSGLADFRRSVHAPKASYVASQSVSNNLHSDPNGELVAVGPDRDCIITCCGCGARQRASGPGLRFA